MLLNWLWLELTMAPDFVTSVSTDFGTSCFYYQSFRPDEGRWLNIGKTLAKSKFRFGSQEELLTLIILPCVRKQWHILQKSCCCISSSRVCITDHSFHTLHAFSLKVSPTACLSHFVCTNVFCLCIHFILLKLLRRILRKKVSWSNVFETISGTRIGPRVGLDVSSNVDSIVVNKSNSTSSNKINVCSFHSLKNV